MGQDTSNNNSHNTSPSPPGPIKYTVKTATPPPIYKLPPHIKSDDQKNDKKSIQWILIAGTTNSPATTRTKDKRRDNGSYLNGVICDLQNMEQFARKHTHLHNTVRDMQYLSKKTVLQRIKQCAATTKTVQSQCRIYYTGHGEIDTGNWCFHDGTISLRDVIEAVRTENKTCRIYLFCDCCYSGNWAIKLSDFKHENNKYWNVEIVAACYPGRSAWDTAIGGKFTLILSKKILNDDDPKVKGIRDQICEGYLSPKGKYKMKYGHDPGKYLENSIYLPI